MPRVKTTLPVPSREKGQRSLDPENYFLWKIPPPWLRPMWYDAEMWRHFVRMQPVAMNCRDSLIASMSSLDWKIEPRDSSQRDELKEEINYYTRFFENNGDMDFIEFVEWIAQDYLDIPFGAGVEVGRLGDEPEGRVVWLEPLDGGTLFPTMNKDFPVGQSVKFDATKQVYFPAHAINRLFISPRTEIERKGWGMPPPEKIYLAMELLNRGDKYYAQLLLDTPEAGILDLIDMDKESATEWIKAFRSLLGGIDPFKIPVLYEHEKPATFIPFGRPPTELMFNQVTAKYAALVAAGYNVALSDIGFPTIGNGGETLAGSIRQERRTRRTGFARLKKKLKFFYDRLLPKELEFKWIDLDDELSVAMGRARLATITALSLAVDKRVITPKEGRLQLIADGLVTISIPEDIPEEEFEVLTETGAGFVGNTPRRPGLLGTQIPPSLGGQGEVKSKFRQEIDLGISKFLDALEDKTECFSFLPDVNAIVDDLSAATGADDEAKEKISEYLKRTVPERFSESYKAVLPLLDVEDETQIADKLSEELINLRYNLSKDFADTAIKILDKGVRKNGSAKKINIRRRNRGNGNNSP